MIRKHSPYFYPIPFNSKYLINGIKGASLITSLLIIFASCNKATPAGFWKNYRKELLVENISDQGPYGGHKAMYWKAKHTTHFNTNEVLGFANKNGWSLVDSTTCAAERVNKWTYFLKAIFPLSHTGFSDTS